MKDIKFVQIAYADTLKADLYMPNNATSSPLVIFVSGMSMFNYRKGRMYQDWCKLLATRGIIGLVYETVSPVSNFDQLLHYITKNSVSLLVNADKIGVWSCSGNSFLAINKVNKFAELKCQSIYYGLTITQPSLLLEEAKELCDTYKISYSLEGEYRSKAAIHMVSAGKDNWSLIQKSQQEFIAKLSTQNVYLEYINFSEGHHSFDIVDDNCDSRRVIEKTLTFFIEQLR